MYLDFLKEKYPQFTVDVSEKEKRDEIAIIKNPNSDNDLEIYYTPDDDFSIFTVYFTYQHAHISDEPELIEYLDFYINSELVAIEFFSDGEDIFGGEIEADMLNDLTAKALARRFGSYKMILNTEFKVRSWSGKYDMDAKIVKKRFSSPKIEKIN